MTKQSQALTRAKIKEAFHQKLEVSKEIAQTLTESILTEMTHLISRNNYLKIVSFGTFLIHEKNARIGRNPKTKVEVTISPRRSVSFRPSSLLREHVNSGKDTFSR